MAGKSKKQQTIAGMNDDKNEALKHALKAMEDQFGPGTIMRLGDQTKLEVETIPTGSIALDRALGVGGLPKGRIIEIYGPESSGKTTVALHCVAEAQKRGLLNLKTTPDCLPYFIKEKNIHLFEEHKVFSETEIRARYEILLENYSKVLNIEALTMLDMANKDLLPAYTSYTKQLADAVASKKAAVPDADCSYEQERISRISSLCADMYRKTEALEKTLLGLVSKDCDELERAKYYRNQVFAAMTELRIVADEIESITDRKCYPYPNYGDLLFGVK